MKQSTKRVVSMLGSLFFVVFGMIIYLNFTQPIYEETQTTKSQERSRQLFVQNQQAEIKKVQTLISNFQSQGQLQQVVSLALPGEPDIPGALAQLNGIAVNNRLPPRSFGISVQGVKSAVTTARRATSTALTVNPLGTVTFQIKVVGTYEDLKNFLKNLETNTRIFDVQSLSVNPVGKTAQNLFNFDLTVAAYYQVSQATTTRR